MSARSIQQSVPFRTPMPFGLGTITSTSDVAGSYWAYGLTGSLDYSTPSQTGSANGFLSVYVPASGDDPVSILNASAELTVVYGGPPSIRVDATRSKIFANGDSENWVTHIITVLADYEHSDQTGTNVASGFAYALSEKYYVGSVVAEYTPVVGPSSTAAHMFGTLPTLSSQVALKFDIGMTNGSPNPNNSTQLRCSMNSTYCHRRQSQFN